MKKDYKKLSIIMPTYNAEGTVEEAIRSIDTQEFTDPFELVFVDDGSADSSLAIAERLAETRPWMKIFKHETNLGGGPAFNTAVEKSTGDVFFCLDSDNVLAPNTLQKMFTHMKEKGADGVAFIEQRFFSGKDLTKYKKAVYDIEGEFVTLGDFLKPGAVMLDQFMMSKDAYYEVGGHPLHHGFTGQCFEVKFVSKGKKAAFCPGTQFYHRNADAKSWFERVYEKGVFSKNFYLIFEEIMHLFSKDIRMKIMQYDIYTHANLYGDNIKNMVVDEYKEKGEGIFHSEYKKYLSPTGRGDFCADNADSTDPADLLCLSICDYWNGQYKEALDKQQTLLKEVGFTPVLSLNMLRTSMALSGSFPENTIEEKTDEIIASMQLRPQPPLFEKPTFFTRILRRVKKLITFNK